MRSRQKLYIYLGMAITGVFAVFYFATIEPESWTPTTREAIDLGRDAAFAALTGHEWPGSTLVWSKSFGKRVAQEKEFFIPPSDLLPLMKELGVPIAAPLIPEVDYLALVALDRWENDVALTFAYQFDGKAVEVPEKGKMLVAVLLSITVPEESWLAKVRGRIFPSSWTLSFRHLRNLGRQRDYWLVRDFAMTATLADYYYWVIQNRKKLADQNAAGYDLRNLEPEELAALLEGDIVFGKLWWEKTRAAQFARVQVPMAKEAGPD